jgi:hypothetical protein
MKTDLNGSSRFDHYEGPKLVFEQPDRDWTALASELEIIRKALADHPEIPLENNKFADRAQELERALQLHDHCHADATAALTELAGLLARVAVRDYGVVKSDEDPQSEPSA